MTCIKLFFKILARIFHIKRKRKREKNIFKCILYNDVNDIAVIECIDSYYWNILYKDLENGYTQVQAETLQEALQHAFSKGYEYLYAVKS